ncbi:MAG: plasmid maintenance system killer protein [bacterium]|nr:plasmid maintenance system killer protein [bacterium]
MESITRVDDEQVRLSGARRTEWSVSVSGKWRIAFEGRDGGIERVNPEDYH